MKSIAKLIVAVCMLGFATLTMAVEKEAWSGKDNNGGKGKIGWETKAKAELVDNSLKIKFTDTQWSGVGLNWEGYWPEDAGVKVADYKFLVIELKAEGTPDDLLIQLTDNKHKDSDTVAVKDYCPLKKLPKTYKEIKIPVKDLLTDKSQFDSGVAWEIKICMNEGGSAKKLTVNIRKISFTK